MYRLETAERGDLSEPPTGVTNKNFAQHWKTDQAPGLDPLGNWTDFWQDNGSGWDLKQEREHNKANEIHSDDPQVESISASTGTNWYDPTHDKAGNMTDVPKPSSLADGLTCKYDAWNRLVEVKDGSYPVGKYKYDGLGRRIERHLDTGGEAGVDRYEHYFYGGVQVVETRITTTESDEPEDLEPEFQYVWSPRYVDAPILRDHNTDQDGLCDDIRLYFLTDANMNVTCLMDDKGDAQERYLYDPYGKVTVYNGSWSSTRSGSAYDNEILYTGRRLDIETGIYYYRARYYHTGLGRFVSRDPSGYIDGFNRYAYVEANPAKFSDPTGLQAALTWPAAKVGGRVTVTAGPKDKPGRGRLESGGGKHGAFHADAEVYFERDASTGFGTLTGTFLTIRVTYHPPLHLAAKPEPKSWIWCDRIRLAYAKKKGTGDWKIVRLSNGSIFTFVQPGGRSGAFHVPQAGGQDSKRVDPAWLKLKATTRVIRSGKPESTGLNMFIIGAKGTNCCRIVKGKGKTAKVSDRWLAFTVVWYRSAATTNPNLPDASDFTVALRKTMPTNSTFMVLKKDIGNTE